MKEMYDGGMWKNSEYAHDVAPPEIEEAVGFNDVDRLREEEAISEFATRCLPG